jgi:hypothetical protein
VLTSAHGPAPYGGTFVRSFGSGASTEYLYRMPGASPATLVNAPSVRGSPPDDAIGKTVSVAHPAPSTWVMTTSDNERALLRLRLTDVPGWHATIDGSPLPLHSYSGMLLQAEIPPGRHIIVVTYWPTAFTVGLLIFAVTVLSLAVAAAIAGYRRRASKAGGPAL